MDLNLKLFSPVVLLMICAASLAHGADWQVSFDARLLSSDSTRSFVEGGLGTLRYGEDKSGLQLARARFALGVPFGEVFALRLDASSWGDHDKNPIDLTDAYLEWRPYPRSGWRARVKAGAFYAPTSLENRAGGWESAYTLSSSALDSWVAEELRTIGMEGRLDWLGTHLGHDFDLGFVAAAFGWNEPAGTTLAEHGFALDDRQTTLFGRVGRVGNEPVNGVQEFREIDGRAGMYAGMDVSYLRRITLQGLHYDNHADPSAFDAVLGESSWRTRFDTAGVRAESDSGWTSILQWMGGDTSIGPTLGRATWKFTTRFLLVSKRFGRQVLSARYDDFNVNAHPAVAGGNQDGHAVTLAYIYEHSRHWRAVLEWIGVRSTQSNRPSELNEPPFAAEHLLQLSVRYTISSP